MSKTILAITFLFAAVFAAPIIPNVEESKGQLIKAGISEDAANGLVSIGSKYRPQLESLGQSLMTMLGELKEESDDYMKSQSESDQKAYNDMQAKMQASVETFQNSL